MPISATGRSSSLPSRRSGGGFTLLEVMVVVAIIGILVGLAVLSVGTVGRDTDIEREMRRLRSLIQLVREEALLQGRDFGLLFSATGYRFYVYDHALALWVEPPQDRLLAARDLPESLRLTLLLEDREVRLPETLDDYALETPQPQVFVLSSGELTPFAAEIGRDLSDERFTLTAELDGEIAIVPPEERSRS